MDSIEEKSWDNLMISVRNFVTTFGTKDEKTKMFQLEHCKCLRFSEIILSRETVTMFNLFPLDIVLHVDEFKNVCKPHSEPKLIEKIAEQVVILGPLVNPCPCIGTLPSDATKVQNGPSNNGKFFLCGKKIKDGSYVLVNQKKFIAIEESKIRPKLKRRLNPLFPGKGGIVFGKNELSKANVTIPLDFLLECKDVATVKTYGFEWIYNIGKRTEILAQSKFIKYNKKRIELEEKKLDEHRTKKGTIPKNGPRKIICESIQLEQKECETRISKSEAILNTIYASHTHPSFYTNLVIEFLFDVLLPKLGKDQQRVCIVIIEYVLGRKLQEKTIFY